MAVFKVIKNVFPNYFRFGQLYKFTSFPKLISTTSINRTIQHKPFAITRTFQSTEETLTVHFDDSSSADFHYIWLRDNCTCKQCVHPKTKQKLLDTGSLTLNISPTYCHVNKDGKLKIVWPGKDGDHPSFYAPRWLHKYASGFQKMFNVDVHDCLPPIQVWNKEYIEENLPEIEYEDLIKYKTTAFTCLDYIHKLGIVFIRNAPQEEGEVLKVMNKIGSVRNTRWGPTFRITSENNPSNSGWLKYEGNLELHTDMNYLEVSPGVQIVHCVKGTLQKKLTEKTQLDQDIHVDGFFVAQWLKENNPLFFETLVTVPVKFRFVNRHRYYVNSDTVLKMNKLRDITEVHYNSRMLAPLEGPSGSILNFYTAYKCFSEALGSPKNQLGTHLKPGDMIIYNNRRILHGRKSSDTNVVTRHLEGCYADMDELMSRYRSYLARRSLIKDLMYS